jgi:hypothetical protein
VVVSVCNIDIDLCYLLFLCITAPISVTRLFSEITSAFHIIVMFVIVDTRKGSF